MNAILTRRIDRCGRVVLPRDARRLLKLEPQDEVQIGWDKEKIVIAKFNPVCKLCGGRIDVEGSDICQSCIDKVKTQ